MAEPPSPPPPRPPPPPPQPARKKIGAKARVRKSKPSAPVALPSMLPPYAHPQGPIIRPPPPRRGQVWFRPPPPPMVPSATGYRPYAFVGFGLYGYGHQSFRPGYPLPLRPTQLLPRPQPQVNGNMGTAGAQTSAFGSLRRGTGVFFPPSRPQLPVPAPNNNNNNTRSSSNNRGNRNKQGAEVPRRTWKRKNTNASNENDGVVMQEECQQNTPSSEMGLPKEWTY